MQGGSSHYKVSAIFSAHFTFNRGQSHFDVLSANQHEFSRKDSRESAQITRDQTKNPRNEDSFMSAARFEYHPQWGLATKQKNPRNEDSL